MKLSVQVEISFQSEQLLITDEQYRPLFVRSRTIQTSWPDPAFLKLLTRRDLETLSDGKSLWVFPRLILSDEETNSLTHYYLALESYHTQTDADMRWANSPSAQAPYVDEKTRIRRLATDRTAKPPKANRITGNAYAFYFPLPLIEVLNAQQLTGVEWSDIRNIKGDTIWETAKLLVAKSLIGPVSDHASFVWMEPFGSEPNVLEPVPDVLIYSQETLSKAQDFNLTSDPLNHYESGCILVGARVRKAVLDSKTRGVSFFPVLAKGSSLESEFTAIWAEFSAKMAELPHVKVR